MRTSAQKQNQAQKQVSSSIAQSSAGTLGPDHDADPLHLQPPQPRSKDFDVDSGTQATARFANDFSRMPVHPKSQVGIQTKLVVNAAGDVYEQEADRAAEQVMRMTNPTKAADKAPSSMTSLVQRRVDGDKSGPEEAPPIVHEVLSSPGQPLDAATRAFMEPRFGHDFSQVRVHTSAAAEQSAREVNANAYTVGQDIAFGAGRFAPGTQDGRRLLAHELTHVIQQQLGGAGPRFVPAVQRQTPPGSQLTGVPTTPLAVVARRIAELALGPHQAAVGAFHGPVLTLIRDTASGEIFVGLNTGVPPKLADVIYKDILRHHADIWSGKVQVVHTDPLALGGGHSEINALNRAVLAQEKRIGHKMTPSEYDTFKSTQLEMQNVWLKGADRRLTIAPSCEHCVGIGSGIRTTPPPAPTSPPVRTGGGEITVPQRGSVTSVSGEITVPQRGSVTPSGGGPSRPVTSVSGEITVPRPKAGFRAGLAGGLRAVFSAENIAAMIPELVLAYADKVAAAEAIRRIQVKFIKEGFAKGFAAGVMWWSEEEVRLNLKNRVTDYRVQGLEDPAGFLTSTYIFQLAEAYENYAVDVGYEFSSPKTSKWKKDMAAKGFAVLAKQGYYFGENPQVLFEYDFIDKLAYVLRDITNPIIEKAIVFH